MQIKRFPPTFFITFRLSICSALAVSMFLCS